jgi:hypothetical protein
MYSDQHVPTIKRVVSELQQLIPKNSDGADLYSQTCQIFVDVWQDLKATEIELARCKVDGFRVQMHIDLAMDAVQLVKSGKNVQRNVSKALGELAHAKDDGGEFLTCTCVL